MHLGNNLIKIISFITFIQLPTNFTVLQAFDSFLKVHKVFHINYHPLIKSLMSFIDYFIFENKAEATVNRKMADLAMKLKL